MVYLWVLPGGDEDPDGDPGALLPVHVHELDVVAVEYTSALQPSDL